MLIIYLGGYIRPRLFIVLYYMAALVFFTGMVFAVTHWGPGQQMLVAGITALFAVTVFSTMVKQPKTFRDILFVFWLSLLLVYFYSNHASEAWRFWAFKVCSVFFWANLAYMVYCKLKYSHA